MSRQLLEAFGHKMKIINSYRFGGADSLLTDLVAWWSLDEESGTRVNNHNPGTSDLTDNNTVLYSAGKVGNAATFVSASSEFLSCAPGHGLHNSDRDWTLAYWVNASALSANTTFISCGVNGSAANIDWFSGYNSIANRLYINAPNGGSFNRIDANNLGAPSTGTWYFVLCERTADTNAVTISVNRGTADSGANATPNNPGGTLRFGVYTDGTSQLFSGSLDETAFWNRLLDTDEKDRLYNSGNGMAYPA